MMIFIIISIALLATSYLNVQSNNLISEITNLNKEAKFYYEQFVRVINKNSNLEYASIMEIQIQSVKLFRLGNCRLL